MSETIPTWWPKHQPIYDLNKTYLENAEEGPFFNGVIPERILPDTTHWIDFLGFKLASPIGVAAGPLLNSRWTRLACDLGYDLVCYKTIRSHAYEGHSLPNIVFIEAPGTFNPDDLPRQVRQQDHPPQSLAHLAITNSFGMPSRDPEYLKKDIPIAESLLHPGQALIVSIVGSGGTNNFVQDFVQTAKLAKECGAKIIEVNFSCPNVSTGQGSIYTNPNTVFEIASSIVKEIGNIPLIIKVGVFEDANLMKKVFTSAAKAGVRAISGINTLSMEVLPALSPDRRTSGICGSPIRLAAIDFVRSARKVIDQEKLGLSLIGVGGITLPGHFHSFFEAGADIAMLATGMMWDPYLATRYHEAKHGVFNT